MRVLSDYVRERIFSVGVAAAVLLVTFGAQILTRGSSGPGSDAGLAVLLVIAFRMADDLADRDRDRRRHPDRALVRARTIRTIVILAGALWCVACLLAARSAGVGAAAFLMVFTAALGAWYVLRGSTDGANRFVLAKYPAFVIVIAGPSQALTLTGATTAVVVYLAACVYEWAHDPDSRVGVLTRSVEATLLALGCVALVLSIGGLR